MPSRRKHAADEEATIEPQGDGSGVPSEAKPRKKAVSHAKKPAVLKTLKSEENQVPLERIPTIIPIKTPAAPAQRISIEPDIMIGQEEQPWTPAPRKDPDLSMPPKPLLQNKAFTNQDVEDIMKADDGEDPEYRNTFQLPVRTGAFRKIALGFAILALLVGSGVAYVAYARATVTVHPQKVEVKTERLLSVVKNPKNEDEIPGEILEVTVAGEKKGVPETSTPSEGIATGFVTLVNKTASDQALVATTRLLAEDGTLFRLKTRVNIPANGRVKAEAYADKAGKSGDLAPARFTIPGLTPELQKSIYAESETMMSGGIVTVGTVTTADIEKTETELRRELVARAREELAKAGESAWTGHALVAETMARAVSVGPGETADGVTVRLTLRVRSVGFDQAKAEAAAAEDLKRSLTSDRELIAASIDDSSVEIDKADPKAGTASIHLALAGQSLVSLESPLFDANKLRGLGIEDVQKYFEGIEGVERVDVKFRPFWLKRMPLLSERIEFQIGK